MRLQTQITRQLTFPRVHEAFLELASGLQWLRGDIVAYVPSLLFFPRLKLVNITAATKA